MNPYQTPADIDRNVPFNWPVFVAVTATLVLIGPVLLAVGGFSTYESMTLEKSIWLRFVYGTSGMLSCCFGLNYTGSLIWWIFVGVRENC